MYALNLILLVSFVGLCSASRRSNKRNANTQFMLVSLNTAASEFFKRYISISLADLYMVNHGEENVDFAELEARYQKRKEHIDSCKNIKLIKSSHKKIVDELEKMFRCPLVKWGRQLSEEVKQHKWSKMMTELNAFKNLPNILKLIKQEIPDCPIVEFKAPLYGLVYKHDPTNGQGYEAIDADFMDFFVNTPTHRREAFRALQDGVASLSTKSMSMLEIVVNWMIENKGVSGFLSLCDSAAGTSGLSTLGKMYVARKPMSVKFTDTSSAAAIVKGAEFVECTKNRVDLRGLPYQNMLVDEIIGFMQSNVLRAHPHNGLLLFTSSATEEQVDYIAKLLKLSICLYMPILRFSFSESDYESANLFFGGDTCKYHQKLEAAIYSVTEDVSAFYLKSRAAFLGADTSALPSELLKAINEHDDITFKMALISTSNLQQSTERRVESLRFVPQADRSTMSVLVGSDKCVIIAANAELSKDMYEDLLRGLERQETMIVFGEVAFYQYKSKLNLFDTELIHNQFKALVNGLPKKKYLINQFVAEKMADKLQEQIENVNAPYEFDTLLKKLVSMELVGQDDEGNLHFSEMALDNSELHDFVVCLTRKCREFGYQISF